MEKLLLVLFLLVSLLAGNMFKIRTTDIYNITSTLESRFEIKNTEFVDDYYLKYPAKILEAVILFSCTSYNKLVYYKDYRDCDDQAIFVLSDVKRYLIGPACFFIALEKQRHAIIGCYTSEDKWIFFDPTNCKFIDPKNDTIAIFG